VSLRKADVAALVAAARERERFATATMVHPGYEAIVADFGCEVLALRLVGGLQGDLLVALHDGDRWGFLVTGYGSCPGCDALEACDTVAEAQALADELLQTIRWFKGPHVLLAHLLARDPATDFWLTEPDGPAALGTLVVAVVLAAASDGVPTARALGDVRAERDRQEARWSTQRGIHPDGTGQGPADDRAAFVAQAIVEAAARRGQGHVTWRMILEEEVAEACAEVDPAKLRAELIQVAAVAVAWVEDLDHRRQS
jgi:hypothetical protein